jgi:hypothetical protein
MDLSTIDPTVIEARGQYATVNGEYKTLMSHMQNLTQLACDDLRHALQQEGERTLLLDHAVKILGQLHEFDAQASELKVQKDALYQIAWGKR